MKKSTHSKYERSNKPNLLLILLCLLFLGLAVFSGYKIISIRLEYREGEQTYEELHQYIQLPTPTSPSDPAAPSHPGSDPGKPAPDDPSALNPEEAPYVSPVDFEALWQINPDVVGWIYIEGTNINYPILQGENNDTYLYRLITGKYNSSGSIFMDYRNQPDFSDPNTVIYGHHMGDGTMFADVVKFQKQSYYQEHSTGYLFTPERTYTLTFFSAYITDVEQNAWETAFSSEEEFALWLRDIVTKSKISPNSLPVASDRILTLSTCTYEFDDARFVLYAIIQ